MKPKWLPFLVNGLLAGALLLAACGPAAQPAADTQPAAAKTEAPAVAPAKVTDAVESEAVVLPEQTQPPAAGQAAKAITITYIDEPESLNPLYTQNWFGWITWDLNLLPLWTIDGQGEYHMELATELPTLENGGVSADGLTITIHLRPEATWSDGTPVTADDAVFTYDMIMAEGNTVNSRYPFDTYIESIQAVDAHTLQIQLTEVYVDWATAFFMRDSRILPKHILQPVFESEGTLDNAAWNRVPDVSNGPFVVTEWETGSHMILQANPLYWRGAPKLASIFIRILPDRAAQMAALKSGDSDIGTYLVGSNLPEVEKMGNVHLVTAFAGNSETLFLNVSPQTASPGMQDVHVRQAIAHAINRQQIIDEIFYGMYEIPATFWFGTPFDDPDLKPWAYDPDLSKRLLEEAGWTDANGDGVREKDGQDLVIRYSTTTGAEDRDAVSVVLQQMLAEVGIRMEINNFSEDVLWATYTDGGPIATGDFDITHWSDGMWYYPSPDTSYFLCDQVPSAEAPDGYNWWGVCIPEMDELFVQQAKTIDTAERAGIFHQIAQIMADEVFWIPIRTDPDIWAVNNRLQNVQISGVHCFWNAYEWDVK